MQTAPRLLAVVLALAMAATALAQSPAPATTFTPPGKIPTVDELSKGIYRMKHVDGVPDSALAVRNMFGMTNIVSTYAEIRDKTAPQWKWSVIPGDAATLNADGRARFKGLVDYPAAGTQVTRDIIADFLGSYRYNTTSEAAFQQSRAQAIAFAEAHRAKRFFSTGLPMFSWDIGNGLASADKQIKAPLALFSKNPVNTDVGAIANGVVDLEAMLKGVQNYIRTGQGGFLGGAAIESKVVGGNKYYKFPGDPNNFYAFKTKQVFFFQKTPQGKTVESDNPSPSRFKNGPDFVGFNLPAVTDGVTDYDAIAAADENAALGAVGNMFTAQTTINGAATNIYTAMTPGNANPITAMPADYTFVDIENPDTWTVNYTIPPRTRFDPALESQAAAQKLADTPLSEVSKSWMEVVSYVESQIVREDGATFDMPKYLMTQYVYVEGGLTYIPENVNQARQVMTNAGVAPPYQPTDTDFGVRNYSEPRFNVEFGDDSTDFTRPVRMYRGYPKLGGGETLVGANDDGVILLSDQVNQDSTLCMNMAMSLATRYRYNPDPNAPKPPPPPADPVEHQAWLNQHFPVCISYYPPYTNNRGQVIGPYVRLAGPIPGYTNGTDEFKDDRFVASDPIPGSQNLSMGTLYRPIRFEGNLLNVVNFLTLPTGHPNKPAGVKSYGAEYLASQAYPYAWHLDFDPQQSTDQGTTDAEGYAVEVIRIPLKPPRLSFVSEVLPIDPRLPTLEQRDADGTVHKALLDAKLRNGPGFGGDGTADADLNTNKPGLGRNNFIYAVVGQCCGPTVLLQATMAQGNRVRDVAGVKQQVGPRPNCIMVVSSEQTGKDGTKQEEALGIPAGFDAKGPAGFAATGSPALKGDYRLDSISSRAGDDYQFGQYSNLAPQIGFDQGGANSANAANPSDAKGKSFLEAQGIYTQGQRYFLDVCAETAVSPQIVENDGSIPNMPTGKIIAYFVKQMTLDIYAPGATDKETSQILYTVKDLKTPPSNPPCSKYEFVPRQVGDYTMVTTITDFNDITRVTRMKIPVHEAGVDVNSINQERERK